jgi:mannose-1-phosphate guanylyltransferase
VGNPKIHYVVEDVPMGTAGPLAVSADLLRTKPNGGLIFVFNSDVTCDFPLENMLESHKLHKGDGTIAVTQVEDPSKYGVVVANQD